jgi:hypothetical protein
MVFLKNLIRYIAAVYARLNGRKASLKIKRKIKKSIGEPIQQSRAAQESKQEIVFPVIAYTFLLI